MKYPVAVEAAAKREILARHRMRYVFRVDIKDDPNPDELELKKPNSGSSRTSHMYAKKNFML